MVAFQVHVHVAREPSCSWGARASIQCCLLVLCATFACRTCCTAVTAARCCRAAATARCASGMPRRVSSCMASGGCALRQGGCGGCQPKCAGQDAFVDQPWGVCSQRQTQHRQHAPAAKVSQQQLAAPLIVAQAHPCLCACRPPASGGANEKEDPGVHTILLHPLHPDQLFVSNQSSTCYLMNMNGQVIKALQSGKRQGGGACVSSSSSSSCHMTAPFVRRCHKSSGVLH